MDFRLGVQHTIVLMTLTLENVQHRAHDIDR